MSRFDVTFIDGLHEEHQADRDIVNSLKHLNPRGIIVLLDCLPPDEWHQRPPAAFLSGENWNGTVWKSALKAMVASEWRCYVVDCDWGCGVIDTAQHKISDNIQLQAELRYGRDFRLIYKYVISEHEFLLQLGTEPSRP